jgi:photosystem II stability/assembly factor-like uncharacterized protein
MKTRTILFSLIFVTSGLLLALLFSNSDSKSYIPRMQQNVVNRDANAAMNWYHSVMANQITGKIDINDIINSQESVKAFRAKKASKSLSTNWIEMGPDNIGGRTRAILIDKDDNNLMFAGGVSGGLWKSTTGGSSWSKVTSTSDDWDNLAVVSICQTTSGHIYVGTGEGMYHNSGSGTGGMKGQGIWKSTDKGATWTRLASTWTTAEEKSIFVNVNKLAAHQSDGDIVYAATRKGLRVTRNGGDTWSSVISVIYGGTLKESSDVKVASDGTVICSIDNLAFISANGDSGSFTKISASSSAAYVTAQLINPASGRLEFAFAPSDPNYVYCSSSKTDGTIENIYRSTDKGQTWTVIGAGNNDLFQPFRNQGTYDNVIAVFPDNKNRILLGGIDVWEWKENDLFKQLTLWSFPPTNPLYVHADVHAIVFHPAYATNKTLFIGSDGGISRSTDGAQTFVTMNKNYNVTQFYAMSFGPDGKIVGGTQDNGSLYIDFSGNTNKAAVEVAGGDGGYTHISTLKPNVMFASVYNGDIRRSEDYGSTMNSYYNAADGNVFVSSFRIWETSYDALSTDSVTYILPESDTIAPYEYFTVKSKMNDRPLTNQYIPATPNDTLYPGDTIMVQDTYQAAIAIGLTNKIIFSRKPLDFGSSATQTIATSISGVISTLEFSKNGNYLYVGTSDGKLYRIDSLLYARNPAQYANLNIHLLENFNGRKVTSISVDPNDAGNVLVTLGNYGNTNYVYYCDKADTTSLTGSNFVEKQGDLAVMPLFASVILWNDSKKVLVGSEYGVFSCSDITSSNPVWDDESTTTSGLSNVPVYMLMQQTWPNQWDYNTTNHGFIYAATHGRGIWRTETFKGPLAVPTINNDKASSFKLNIYPNPASDYASFNYAAKKPITLKINIYDLNGKMVKSDNVQVAGTSKVTTDITNLKTGTYFMSVNDGQNKYTSKFIVY